MDRGANHPPSIEPVVVAVLLDTNIFRAPSPEPAVETWAGEHPAMSLYFSVIGEAELLYGVAILPMGRRRDALALAIEAILREDFDDRILSFDSGAARAYADIAAKCRSTGHPVQHIDCQIAAIARSRGMAVATRNIRDFQGMGIELVDPWTAG